MCIRDSGTGRPYAEETLGNPAYLNDEPVFIFAVAIVLFLLVITLSDPGKSEAVISEFWI